MPPEATGAEPERIYLTPQAEPRDPLPAERVPLSPEQEGEDDRLEPPGLDTRLILRLTAALVLFITVVLVLMLVFFRITTGGAGIAPPLNFPLPHLETNIDPRVLPAAGGGPAEPRPPLVPQLAPQPLDQAMQIIAARGVHAYDPPPPPPAPTPTPTPTEAKP